MASRSERALSVADQIASLYDRNIKMHDIQKMYDLLEAMNMFIASNNIFDDDLPFGHMGTNFYHLVQRNIAARNASETTENSLSVEEDAVEQEELRSQRDSVRAAELLNST